MIAAIIQAALQAGVQLAPFVEQLFAQRSQLQQPNRPDVSDADRAAMDALIRGLQAKIDAG
jgi:hypothetical protein